MSFDDSMDHGQAEAGTFADRLGCEERFEEPIPEDRRESDWLNMDSDWLRY